MSLTRCHVGDDSLEDAQQRMPARRQLRRLNTRCEDNRPLEIGEANQEQTKNQVPFLQGGDNWRGLVPNISTHLRLP
jgi:hypothetical protein